jgi:predicted deacetylase
VALFVGVICFLGILLFITNYAALRPRFVKSPFLSQQPHKIPLIFRYDDFSTTSKWEVGKELIRILQKFQMPCTLGVIPFVCQGSCHDLSSQSKVPLSREKVDLIRETVKTGLIEVALHGFSHQTTGKRFWFGHSEFHGLSLQDQVEKIKAGKEYLEKAFNCRIVTFIPPWNNYDQNTLTALEKLNFLCLSARLWGSSNRTTSLQLVPSTCKLAQLKDTIFLVRESKTNSPLICVTLHDFDFQECSYQNKTVIKRISLREFESLLAWIASQEDVVVKNFQQLVAAEIPTFTTNPLPALEFFPCEASSYSLALLSLFPSISPTKNNPFRYADHIYNNCQSDNN